MTGSISDWLDAYRHGDRDAAQQLWNRYYAQLVRQALRGLRGAPRRLRDEEDIALSAFNSFCLAVEAGRFPNLFDRSDLWRILVAITAKKALNERRYQRAKKRFWFDAWSAPDRDSLRPDSLVGKEPSPEQSAEAADHLSRLLSILNEHLLQQIAICKLEGYTNAEIAQRLDCSVSTVGRKITIIRDTWIEYFERQ
ncbi:MAG TPA: ECF-type sigma factor [Pirellulales bacterium]|jgi:DNA-directed RNA polymerase specialized sigma24 family protein